VAEIIIALDLPGAEARRLLDRIPEARWVKVGSILFAEEGPALVRELVGRGLQVFLDLKWHDIPNTVSEAVKRARDLGVAMATVHTLGGRAMLEAAAKSAGNSLGVVGVTVLTSHTPASYAETMGRSAISVAAEVDRLSHLAFQSGLKGVVCSPLEASLVHAHAPVGSWLVIPGIRRPSDPPGDQARTATPTQARAAGATHLVVGRPILAANRPEEIHREFSSAAT
jgi:orotidine-5'-phosphate decarboxylase